VLGSQQHVAWRSISPANLNDRRVNVEGVMLGKRKSGNRSTGGSTLVNAPRDEVMTVGAKWKGCPQDVHGA